MLGLSVEAICLHHQLNRFVCSVKAAALAHLIHAVYVARIRRLSTMVSFAILHNPYSLATLLFLLCKNQWTVVSSAVCKPSGINPLRQALAGPTCWLPTRVCC
eukprot:scpid102522/ scgid9893/ 